MQSARTVLLVRPARFAFNAETAASNHFQRLLAGLSADEIHRRACTEFDNVVHQLRARQVNVLVVEDTPAPPKPDAIFPNNWLSTHADGRALLYPLHAPNRRPERRADVLETLSQQFQLREIVDFSGHEAENHFLEGTGSIIFDHRHCIAYACLSPRTDAGLLGEVAGLLDYRPLVFHATDAQGQAIYHTNVMLCIGAEFAVVCLESIRNEAEQQAVAESLRRTGHELIPITLAQVARFVGNMLTLQPATGRELLAMSQSAFEALAPEQRTLLERYCEMLPLPIPTIETIGGGSVRCMLAEVFLPAKNL
ncbi:arginine deiminase-related protein [Hymenobacter sp. ASUV-10]|uniref:Arginine deiminase-related protein n=1 Tax=Hymenobacter aranciens TaxID=3063996 RepID=A0ABT9BEM1_9BACT|nr:arginine deiminase-related protein [Hymenobacter sp. ASUV-10]MDO7876705.1 arginine deiminase-related protein [Hymenobacter sp. ASUV-10]